MKNYIYSFFEVFVGKGFALIFSLLLGNFLSPDDLGLYLSYYLIVSYGITFFGFEINSGIIKKLNDSATAERKNNVFSSGLIATFLSGFAALLLCVVFDDFVISKLRLAKTNFFYLFPPLILISLLAQYFQFVLTSDLKFKGIFWTNFFSKSVQVLCVVLFIKTGMQLLGVVISLYAALFVSLLSFGFYAFRKYKLKINGEILPELRPLLSFSFLIYTSTIVIFLDNTIDLFFINFYMDKDQLALYNYAISLSLLLLVIGHSISAVNYPRMSVAFSSHKKEDIEKVYSSSFNTGFFLVAAAALLILTYFDLIIPLVLPPFYLQMKSILFVLVMSMTLFSTTASVGTILTAFNKPQAGLIVLIPCLLINISLCIFLVPRMGAIGAAIATGTSFFLRAFFGILLTEYYIGTGYKYYKIIICFLLLIAILGLNYFLVENLMLKTLLVFAFFGVSFKLLIEKEAMQALRAFRSS